MKNLLLLCIVIKLVWIADAGSYALNRIDPEVEMDIKEKTRQIVSLLQCWNCEPSRNAFLDPRLQKINMIARNATFRTFDRTQVNAASEVFNVVCSAVNFDDFLYLIRNVRDNCNSDLFLFVLYSSVFHRADTQYVQLPRIEEVVPHWFFEAETIQEAVRLAKDRPNEDLVLIHRKTSKASKLENRLSYFREDVNLNSHHWAYHIIFPFTWNSSATGIIKDRKGEFFYYMHTQMIARYSAERMSNGMPRLQPIPHFHAKLQGYDSHLTTENIGVNLAARPPGLVLRDVPQTSTVENMEEITVRILEAIDSRVAIAANGSDVFLDNERGIDILGSLLESSVDSINFEFYGSLHNYGHRMVSRITDPDGIYQLQPNAMGFTQTAPRDPIFYTYHESIDRIFRKHLDLLPPYSRDELSLPYVHILNAKVTTDKSEPNVLKTFPQEDYADISHSRFLQTYRRVLVKYMRLDHKPFTYHIDVKNNAYFAKDVTVRIFLAPKFDEFGHLLEVNEQRKLMIELDKFHHKLTPGHNYFQRNSRDSTVTLLERAPPFSALKNGEFTPTLHYCNCGWPQHLLIPRGSSSGMDFTLFVMMSDYDIDNLSFNPHSSPSCTDALSYCGAKDQMYPDRKPMGFPFDRVIPYKTLQQFLTMNMAATDIKIRYLG